MIKRGIRRSSMTSSVPTIIVEARLACSATTATTRTASTSPTRTNRSDKRSTETVTSIEQIVPNAHYLREALRLATDRKVLRAPSSSRRLPPVPPPKPSASTLQASRIASRITTRRCLSRELQSDGSWMVESVTCRHAGRHSTSPETSSQSTMARNTAAAVRVSRTKSGVDNLDSEFTKNKDHHSSAAGGGMASNAAPVNDWPLLQAVAQEVLSQMTQEGVAEPRLSDADLKEAIQLLMEKRAREQQQQQQQQKGEQQMQKQKQPLTASGCNPTRRMVAQREVEMACGFGDGRQMDDGAGGGGGGQESGRLRLIVCIAQSGDATTQSLEKLEDTPEQPPPPKSEMFEKFKVKLSHFEPSIVLEAAEENPSSLMHARLNLHEGDDGLSLPGVELWRDSSSCIHNAEILETETAAAQAVPPQPKVRASKLLIGMSLRESLRYSMDHEKMRRAQKELIKEQKWEEALTGEQKICQLQQELMQEWKQQKARDSKGDVSLSDESDVGNMKSDETQSVSSRKSNKSSVNDNEEGIEGGPEFSVQQSKRDSSLSVSSQDSMFLDTPDGVPSEPMRKGMKGGQDGRKASTRFLGLDNIEALMERRKELQERLSKIQMPIISCPAAVFGHLEDHQERMELAKELVMNLQPPENYQIVVQAAGVMRQGLNLQRPLRLNQYRRGSEDIELDNKSEDF